MKLTGGINIAGNDYNSKICIINVLRLGRRPCQWDATDGCNPRDPSFSGRWAIRSSIVLLVRPWDRSTVTKKFKRERTGSAT
eukprot:3992085-Karenia_brevis.AAC.1